MSGLTKNEHLALYTYILIYLYAYMLICLYAYIIVFV